MRDRSVPHLATLLTLVMVAMLTMRCESQETADVKGAEDATEESFRLLMLRPNGFPVNILINRPQGTIQVRPPHVDICRGAVACPHDEFQWQIAGGLQPDERLE